MSDYHWCKDCRKRAENCICSCNNQFNTTMGSYKGQAQLQAAAKRGASEMHARILQLLNNIDDHERRRLYNDIADMDPEFVVKDMYK